VLDERVLDASVPEATASVRVLLMHLAGGQQAMLLRARGSDDESELSRDSTWPGLDEVARELKATSEELVERASALAEGATIEMQGDGVVHHYPVSVFLNQAVSHGIELRTEIKMALGHLGVGTPDFDHWSFVQVLAGGGKG
jgi:hypothetical protein